MQNEKYDTRFNMTRFIDITYRNAYILYAGKPYLEVLTFVVLKALKVPLNKKKFITAWLCEQPFN